MTFERYLTRHLASLLATMIASPLASCSGSAPSQRDVSRICESKDQPAGTVLAEGYQTVPAGSECPSADQAEPGRNSCSSYPDWQGVTCSLDRVEENKVWVSWDTGGGAWMDAEPGETNAVDVCYYTAQFGGEPAVCGRPLLTDAGPVLAGTSAQSSWRQPGMDVDLDPAVASEAREWWLEAARLEHASIASFSRFVLELMQLGAPPELVDAALAAARDEVRHAQLCFGLASAYGQEPMGPGPMDLDGAELVRRDLGSFVESLVREGCVGEALAAIEAAARLAGALEPGVRQALEQIVADEGEHAALAWRTLAWVLEIDTTGVARARAAEVFDTLREPAQAGPNRPADPIRTAHGLMDPATRSRVLADGRRRVLLPAWEALSSAPGNA